jgi:hypothetical protein
MHCSRRVEGWGEAQTNGMCLYCSQYTKERDTPPNRPITGLFPVCVVDSQNISSRGGGDRSQRGTQSCAAVWLSTQDIVTLTAAKRHQQVEPRAGRWRKSYTVGDNLVGLATGLRIHTEIYANEGTRRTSTGDDCGTRGDADAGGNSIQSGRQDSTEIASICRHYTGRARIADAANLFGDCFLESLKDASRLFRVNTTTTKRMHGEQVIDKKTSQELVQYATARPMETAFADDTILQDAVALKVQFALDACAMWARKSGMHRKFGKLFVMMRPGMCPLAGGFELEGENPQVVSKVKIDLGVVLDANGASAESSRGRMWAAMARLVEMLDAGALARGMRPTGAAHFYDKFVSSMWRRDVLLTPISPADTKMINDLDLLLLTQVLAKVRFTEGNVNFPRSLLRLDSPMLYKR